jgi:protein tyrosine/serine phosphatase
VSAPSPFVRQLATAAVLGFVLAIPCSARSGPGATKSAIHIDNFGCVNEHYYRGAQPKNHDYADLAALGIRTVIDLTKEGEANEHEPTLVQNLGMKFHRIAMTTHETPSADTVATFLQLVNDPTNQPVFVHCQGGRHRTGLMTAIYRMTMERWAANDAFAEMKHYKFGADYLHPEFKKFVLAYRPENALAIGLKTVIQGSVPK